MPSAGEPDRVGLLNLDGAAAAAAGDAQHMPLDVAEPLILDRIAGCPTSAEASSRTACQYSGGNSSAGPTGRGVWAWPPTAAAASFSICFGVGMRQFAGRSDILRYWPNQAIRRFKQATGINCTLRLV